MEDIPDNKISEKDLKKLEAYNRLIEKVKGYQKQNPEKLKASQAKYYKKSKEENPERYEKTLEKQRIYYANVVKPRKEALKKANESIKELE